MSTSIPEPAARRSSLRRTAGQLWDISRAFFVASGQRRARAYLVVLLVLALAVGGVQVLASYVGRDFMTAIANKEADAYWRLLGIYIATFAAAVPLGVYYRWTESRLALLWREWLAEHLIQRYFNNRASTAFGAPKAWTTPTSESARTSSTSRRTRFRSCCWR